MSIRGKLTIERADNGVIVEWYEGREMNKFREVFVTSGALINRLDSLLDVFGLDGLHVVPAPQSPEPAPSRTGSLTALPPSQL